MGQFGVSQGISRLEDDRLLTGQGQFADDEAPVNLVHGVMVRSPFAHARISQLDVSEALQMDGVLAVVTGADLMAEGIDEIPWLVSPTPKPGTEFRLHGQPVLATDTVRFVGDCIAFVVAETLEAARDAAELVEIDFDMLPIAMACDEYAHADPAQIWPDAPYNQAFEWECGDKAETKTDFDAAAHVVTLRVVNNRVILSAIETRGAIGSYDRNSGKFTLTTGSQMPNSIKEQLVAAQSFQ